MTIEVFSETWARKWCDVLNSRSSYREAAKAWEGAVALAMSQSASSDSPQRAVFLDLWHGECRTARLATPEDLVTARYVIAGSAAAWREVLAGRIAPLMAVMSGKIRLTKGSMASLLPMAGAARELVAAALEMEVTFPDGW